MNTKLVSKLYTYLLFGLIFMVLSGCERNPEDLSPVTFPANPEVFIDDFSSGLNYAAFGGSVPDAFQVDKKETFNNSAASMRFDVPNEGNPKGTYAGGVFFTGTGRDLSGFNVLTFWAKATESARLNVVGFGNDLGESKYQASISDLSISTNWIKYYIPIPDPSKLTAERGMFFYSVASNEGKGFSFWIDEVKFENLGTVAHPQFAVLNGQDQVETAFIGVSKSLIGLTTSFNLPSGINQSVSAAPAYFEFKSSDPAIATVDATGKISVIGGPGSSVITASVNGIAAKGSLKIDSKGAFQHAPVPTIAPGNVNSIFSDAYTNIPVDYYNGYWQPYQTTLSADFEIDGDRILHYTDFNFVGIQFSSPTLNASSMTHFHADIFIPSTLPGNAQFRIELVDNAGGGTGVNVRNISVAQSQQWISLEIPLTGFTGLSSRNSLWQVVFVDVNGNIPAFYADNIYFHK